MEKKKRAADFFSGDRIAALLFLGAVAVYGWEGSKFTAALQVDVIGPSFFPRILAVFGVVLALLLFFTGAARDARSKQESQAGSHGSTLAPAALLLGYALAFEPAGFLLTTPVFLAVAFKILGHPGWRGAIASSLVVTAVAFALFDYGLGLKLPLGPLAGFR